LSEVGVFFILAESNLVFAGVSLINAVFGWLFIEVVTGRIRPWVWRRTLLVSLGTFASGVGPVPPPSENTFRTLEDFDGRAGDQRLSTAEIRNSRNGLPWNRVDVTIGPEEIRRGIPPSVVQLLR
jgi:hypothetical protein